LQLIPVARVDSEGNLLPLYSWSSVRAIDPGSDEAVIALEFGSVRR
jgi:hypothetical protein